MLALFLRATLKMYITVFLTVEAVFAFLHFFYTFFDTTSLGFAAHLLIFDKSIFYLITVIASLASAITAYDTPPPPSRGALVTPPREPPCRICRIAA